jgi:GABA permease
MTQPERTSSSDLWRILVVANETVASDALRDTVAARASGGAEVLVVAPALVGRLGWLSSADDEARASAAARVEHCLESLRQLGVDAQGHVGDSDPLRAIEDAMRTFPADEVVLATHPPGRSHWLEQGLVERAQERLAVPLHHVVVEGVAVGR